jgi:regulator of replication initiation timing
VSRCTRLALAEARDGWLARPVQEENGVTVDRGNVESAEAAEDAVRKIQRLKKSFVRSRMQLSDEAPGSEGHKRLLSALPAEMKQWEDSLEEIRCDLANLLAERDRLRIAHDKLRERIERHTMEPRSEERRVPSQKPVTPQRLRPADESQDFTAIDKELERLNASMMRAFSSSSE